VALGVVVFLGRGVQEADVGVDWAIAKGVLRGALRDRGEDSPEFDAAASTTRMRADGSDVVIGIELTVAVSRVKASR
jgi:hypothetical protein